MIAGKGVGSVLPQGEPQSTPGDIGLVSSMSAFRHCKPAPEQIANVRGKDEIRMTNDEEMMELE